MEIQVETEKKAAAFALLAALAGFLLMSLTGCATTTEAKIHTGGKTYSAATGVGVRMEDSQEN